MFRNRTQKRIVSIALTAVMLLSGCSGSADSDEEIVIIEQEEEPVEYTLGAATIEDVVNTQRIRCTYQQINDEEVSFQMGGKKISHVYVEEGDIVRSGDLLAEITSDSIGLDISRLEYEIARNEMLIRQAEADKLMEIMLVNQKYQNYEQTEEIQLEWAEAKEAVEDSYQYRLEDCRDAIEVAEMRLALLREEQEKGRIYAGLSGMVSFVKKGLEGSTSIEGEVVIRIIDNNQCIFASEQVEFKDYFTGGMELEVRVTSGTSAGMYPVVPYRMGSWSDEMYFAFSDPTQSPSLEVGSSGEIILTLEERLQVLAVPKKAVHEADGRSFVYVLGENQVREVHFITTGVAGDQYIEVTEGLEEGDRVILK